MHSVLVPAVLAGVAGRALASGHLGVLAVEVLGCLLSAGYALPQLARLLTTKKVEGLSGPALVVPPLASLAWIGYFAWQARYGVLVSDTLYLPGELLVVAALVRAGGTERQTWAAAAGAAGVFALAAATGHPIVLATVLTAVAAVQYSLAVRAAYRAPSTAGISAPGWLISLASGSLWLPYGLLVHDAGVTEWAALTLVAAVVVLARLAADRGWLGRPEGAARPARAALAPVEAGTGPITVVALPAPWPVAWRLLPAERLWADPPGRRFADPGGVHPPPRPAALPVG